MSITVSGIIAAVKRDGGIAFAALARDIEAGAAAMIKILGPAASTLVATDVRLAKQFASDAITMADGYLSSHQQAIALATEQAIETEFGLLTKGASVPLNGLTTAGIDQLVAAAVSAAHNAGLAIKAALAAAPASVGPGQPVNSLQMGNGISMTNPAPNNAA